MAEGKSLITQEQKPAPLLRGSKNWASSNPDQDDSCKRCKAAQLKNQLPKITSSSQVDTDLMDDLHPPIAADTDQQRRFIERSWGVMGICWMSSRRHLSSHSDGEGRDNDGRDDGDEDKVMVKEDKDEDKDEDGDRDEDENRDKDEDRDKDEEYKDRDKEEKDEPPFCDSEIPGISNWDLLGEYIKREAATLGLYSSYELSA